VRLHEISSYYGSDCVMGNWLTAVALLTSHSSLCEFPWFNLCDIADDGNPLASASSSLVCTLALTTWFSHERFMPRLAPVCSRSSSGNPRLVSEPAGLDQRLAKPGHMADTLSCLQNILGRYHPMLLVLRVCEDVTLLGSVSLGGQIQSTCRIADLGP
jgi:hypothetical protein